MDKGNEKSRYRIDGFAQIKHFYEEFVLDGTFRIAPTHISLYIFIWHQCNRMQWAEWIKLPREVGMQGACIASPTTYYKILHELETWKLIEYHKGVADKFAPEIKLLDLRIPLNGIHTGIHAGIHAGIHSVPFNITDNNVNGNGVTSLPSDNSFSEFKEEVTSFEFLDEVNRTLKFDKGNFSRFTKEWIAKKDISKDYSYSRERLKQFLLDDFQKGSAKATSQTFTTLNPHESSKKNLQQH